MPAPFFLFPLQSRIPCCETFWLRCGMWHVACGMLYPTEEQLFCLLFSITDESLGFTCVSFTHGLGQFKVMLQQRYEKILMYAYRQL